MTAAHFTGILNETLGFLYDIKYNTDNLKMLDVVFQENNKTVFEVMDMLVQPCDELMEHCRWQGKIVPCHNIFEVTITYYGICCSFNNNNRIGSVEFVLTHSSINNVYLFYRRTNLFGYLSGLSIVMNPVIEREVHASVLSQSVRTIIHDANLYPSFTNIEKFLQLGSEVFVQLSASEIHCSAAVANLPQSSRQCFFENEIQLR